MILYLSSTLVSSDMSIGPLVHSPSVHWSIGPLDHGSIGTLVDLSIGPLVHWSIGPLRPLDYWDHWSIGPLVNHSISPLVHWSFGPLVQMSIRLKFCRSVPPEFLRSFFLFVYCQQYEMGKTADWLFFQRSDWFHAGQIFSHSVQYFNYPLPQRKIKTFRNLVSSNLRHELELPTCWPSWSCFWNGHLNESCQL